MNTRSILITSLLLTACGVGCNKQDRERIGAIPAQSEVRAEQVEAQQLLQQVYAMQEMYYTTHQQYGASLGDIGVAVPRNARYRYDLSATGSAWRCQATANLDLDATIDSWVVDQAGGVTCTTDDATS
jgi:hypothetical protein